MFKNKGFVVMVFLLALTLVTFVSIGRALLGSDTCQAHFPDFPCHNGGCYQPLSSGNCVMSNCLCVKYMYYFDHDCNDGKNTPPCD
jgi:hypothetical protein